jgi:hypothetical protein
MISVLDWNAGQWIAIALLVAGPLGGLVLHGKPIPDPHIRFHRSLGHAVIWACVLGVGGFWS